MASLPKENMQNPSVNADDYAVDSVDAAPKHGTSVQAGWGAADAFLKPKAKSGEYASEFRMTEQPQLVRFLEDGPFMVYEQHWIDRSEGKRSFVCLGEDCPLCIIANDKPRAKFAFNIVNLSEEEPTTQIMTVATTLARQLRAANDDTRRGPLTKFYWAISRQGTGPSTSYTLDRVRGTDLAEEWELDADEVEAVVATAVSYDEAAIYVSPREELLKVAQSLLNNN